MGSFLAGRTRLWTCGPHQFTLKSTWHPRLTVATKLRIVLWFWIVPFSTACVTAPRPPTASGQEISSEGLASWYGKQFAGRKTANGERFEPGGLTAAHRTLKFGTCVEVELLSNGRKVQVRINDRGPFVHDRIIDLSEEAAKQLGLLDEGVGEVRLSRCN